MTHPGGEDVGPGEDVLGEKAAIGGADAADPLGIGKGVGGKEGLWVLHIIS